MVYSALDREFSEPILERFTQETRIRALPKYDLESAKTVGLTSAIIAEASRPRCDVFWNNEILNTLRLKEQGLLEVYHSPLADTYPARGLSSRSMLPRIMPPPCVYSTAEPGAEPFLAYQRIGICAPSGAVA